VRDSPTDAGGIGWSMVQWWGKLVGFVPDDVAREAQEANHADLLLTSGSRAAVVAVKVGHLMSTEQQEKYEALPSQPDLYLAALSFDKVRLEADSHRWSFLSLSDLVGRWAAVDTNLPGSLPARLPASCASGIRQSRGSSTHGPQSR
jgi:hypothetical protein